MSYNMPVYDEQGTGIDKYVGGGSQVFAVAGTATLAEINAGKTLIEGVPGRSIRVIGYRLKCTGSFGALTAIELQESDGSPVVVSWAQANLTDGAIFSSGAAATGQTIGAGFNADLAAGNGLILTKTGSTATTATGVDYVIQFLVS